MTGVDDYRSPTRLFFYQNDNYSEDHAPLEYIALHSIVMCIACAIIALICQWEDEDENVVLCPIVVCPITCMPFALHTPRCA